MLWLILFYVLMLVQWPYITLLFLIISISYIMILVSVHQPIYGFASNDPLRFKRAAGQKDLFYVNDLDLDLKNVRS